MLNMNIETTINSVPFLNYMQQENQQEQRKVNVIYNSYTGECDPPQTEKRDKK